MLRRVVVLLVAMGVPGAGFAQAVDQDLAEAAGRRQTVYVVDRQGRETTGRLMLADPASITIETSRGIQSFNLRNDLQAVYRRGDSVKNGAMIGAVTGAVLGALIAGNASCGPLLGPTRGCNAVESMIITGYLSGFGAGVGVGIDALVRGRTRIYPLASRDGFGASFSARW
jgi:hypothetical protein